MTSRFKEKSGTPITAQRRTLSVLRKEIVGLSPEKALSRILDAPQPVALVHSFPEQDLHLLIREIGAEESLPIVSLASNRQWEYLLDVETWEKDRLNVPRMTQWLERLLRADTSPARLRWLLREKTEIMEYYLFRSVDISLRMPQEDFFDVEDGFTTLDGVIYFRVRDRRHWASDADPDAGDDGEREPFPMMLLRQIAEHDYESYQRLLVETGGINAAESEEAAYRWRNVRLSEKGIPPFEEAVGIYQALKPEALAGLPQSARPRVPKEMASMVPEKPMRYLKGTGVFETALTQVDHPGDRERLRLEFTSLANRIIVADHQGVREPEDLKKAVQKACGFLSIGLDRLTDPPAGEMDRSRAAGCLLRYPLTAIFQVGWSEAVHLKKKAVQWFKNAWFSREGFPLSFWGETGMGVLGGLLLKRPRCYDALGHGSFYREFETSKDLADTHRILERIIAMDQLLSRLPMTVGVVKSPVPVSFQNLLLTLWVRDFLGLPKALEAIGVGRFREFFQQMICSGQARIQEAIHRPALPEPTRRAFQSWVSEKSDLPSEAFIGPLDDAFDALFEEIAEQCGALSPEDLDPRFIDLFLLEGPGAEHSLKPSLKIEKLDKKPSNKAG